MRRKDKEITDQRKLESILKEAQILRLAMVDSGRPYLVAVNFAYLDGVIYIHSAREGRKLDILRKDDRVAFQTETDVKIIIVAEACDCTTCYSSVFGTGKAVFVEDRGETVRALDAIMSKYSGIEGFQYPQNALDKTLVVRIDIDYFTGKRSGYMD